MAGFTANWSNSFAGFSAYGSYPFNVHLKSGSLQTDMSALYLPLFFAFSVLRDILDIIHMQLNTDMFVRLQGTISVLGGRTADTIQHLYQGKLVHAYGA